MAIQRSWAFSPKSLNQIRTSWGLCGLHSSQSRSTARFLQLSPHHRYWPTTYNSPSRSTNTSSISKLFPARRSKAQSRMINLKSGARQSGSLFLRALMCISMCIELGLLGLNLGLEILFPSIVRKLHPKPRKSCFVDCMACKRNSQKRRQSLADILSRRRWTAVTMFWIPSSRHQTIPKLYAAEWHSASSASHTHLAANCKTQRRLCPWSSSPFECSAVSQWTGSTRCSTLNWWTV